LAQSLLANDTRLEEIPNYRLSTFVRDAWHTVEPATPLDFNWHAEIICDHLEAVSRGEIKRLIINVPPRHGKSLLVSVLWPAWSWIQDPHTRWLFASYSGELSMKHSVDRRTVIRSLWYQERFAWRFTMMRDQNAKTEFLNDSQGVMYAGSVGGSITGRGGDFLILDDPHNTKELQTETQLENAIRFYQTTLVTRLNDPERSAIVIIMQRLHENDLTGHLLATEPEKWTHLCLRGIAEEKETFKLKSGKAVVRMTGDPLWPSRYPRSVLDEQRRTMGSYNFAGQIQQRPSPREGTIFNPNHWRRFRVEQKEYPNFYVVAISVDAAFKAGIENDFVGIQCWGFTGDGRSYILDYRLEHLGYSATKAAIRGMKAKWEERGVDVHVVLIEDAANGPAIIEELSQEFTVHALETAGGKLARAYAVQPDVEAGNVYVPDDTEWGEKLVQRAAGFPTIKNDDDIDAMTHALNWRRRHGLGGVIALWKEEAEKMQAARASRVGPQEPKTIARDLAEAQRAQSVSMGSFPASEPTERIRSRPSADGFKACPQCGNTNLARQASSVTCRRCGWRERIDPFPSKDGSADKEKKHGGND
jgi:predicted phage terminase large subunit-like protein